MNGCRSVCQVGPDHRAEKWLPSSRAHGPDGASTGLKGGEAVRQIDFGDWWGRVFPHPALSGCYSRHLSFHPMHRSGADAKCLRRFEDSRTCRQLLTDALDDILAHRTTPEPFPLAPRP